MRCNQPEKPDETLQILGELAATRTIDRELSEMNSKKADDLSSQETEVPDPPAKVLHPARDDDEESADKSKPVEKEEDKKKTEVVTKEAMLRVTSGQL
jgi:hypothetical protein